MAIKRDFQHPASGLKALEAYWRINSYQVLDAPQDGADRGVVYSLAAYTSRAKSKEADSSPIPITEAQKQVLVMETPAVKTESGNVEVRLEDGGDRVAVDAGDFDRSAISKGQGYALIRKYHAGFKGAASKDIIEAGQVKATL